MSAAVIATTSDRTPIGEYISPKWRSSRSLKDKFIGTWKLVSWKIEQADGEVTDSPLGSNPLGWIMYQPGGRVCVALMRPDRPKFASNNLVEATPEEIKAGFEGYMGYCGSYEVNERERFIIHHLELSWFPNWVETDQKRYFEFTGNRLTLKTPPVTFLGAAQVHRVVWERLQ
jgi:Lipocalin-like domain